MARYRVNKNLYNKHLVVQITIGEHTGEYLKKKLKKKIEKEKTNCGKGLVDEGEQGYQHLN